MILEDGQSTISVGDFFDLPDGSPSRMAECSHSKVKILVPKDETGLCYVNTPTISFWIKREELMSLRDVIGHAMTP